MLSLTMEDYIGGLLDAYVEGINTARAILQSIPDNRDEMMEVFKTRLLEKHGSNTEEV
jgi:hypothetical protein